MRFIPTALAIIATLVACASAAEAQEGRGSRFSYAANYWKVEEPRMPRSMQPTHAVKQGAVPGQSMLGLDPQMLTPTPAPAPVRQVAARPVTTQVTPNIFVPRTQPTFKSDFGKPVSTQPMQIAQLPQPAAAPAPIAMAKPAQAAPVKVARHSGGRRRPVSTSVSGQLRRPSNPVGQQAAPASYGNNFGYVPGGSVHSTSGGTGSGTVTGRIVGRGK